MVGWQLIRDTGAKHHKDCDEDNQKKPNFKFQANFPVLIHKAHQKRNHDKHNCQDQDQ